MAQGVLPFRYESEPTASGMTALAGLPPYLELAIVSRLTDSIRRHLQVCSGQKQGWKDTQIVMSLVLLNIAGGDCVDDLRILEKDDGFARVLRRVEWHGLRRKEWREQERCWRKERKRAVPSPSVVFRYLSAFDNRAEEAKRTDGHAFIPAANKHLRALSRVTEDFLRFVQRKSPQREATLDQDASLVATWKAEALYGYLGDKTYQPMTTYWAEQALLVHSEFRDGNVPANYQNLRALQETLDALPEGVVKVYFRSDTAANQKELLRYCAEGKNERFGVIEFAVGVDVTAEFKRAVAEVVEGEWQPLEREVDGQRVKTEQEWAEVCFVPNWTAQRKEGPVYRYLAIRELLGQAELPGLEAQLPFPRMSFGQRQYKVFGMVTNRDIPGDKLIWWHRERCGKGEEIHKIMKEDLAGGRLPSGRFGVNAAWWGIMVIAFNLNSLMKRLVLPQGWAPKRLKAIRFGFINLAGRVVSRARQLIIRLSGNHPAFEVLMEVRQRLRDLWTPGESIVLVAGSP
ncbi:MAG: IS1380 family transposase [Dehalococcoidales bacterium]|nr:IS1380 family transposase [Dehalococcoidales bacterium]